MGDADGTAVAGWAAGGAAGAGGTAGAGPEAGDAAGAGLEESGAAVGSRPVELLDMVWPETGLQTAARAPRRPKDGLTEDDLIELQVDFVTLALSPLEFIQLASALRLSIDGLLEQHPALQRAVINAFDLRA